MAFAIGDERQLVQERRILLPVDEVSERPSPAFQSRLLGHIDYSLAVQPHNAPIAQRIEVLLTSLDAHQRSP